MKESSVTHTRRLFIRNFVAGSVISSLMGKSWLATLLADCQPNQPGAGILRIKIADFPPLLAPNGSVRLEFNPFTVSGPSGAFYPILINRGDLDQFYTLSTQCQHQSCVVPTYNAASGAIICSCHGSHYAIDGSVRAGPTLKPLIAYANSFDGTVLCVEIPKLGFEAIGTTVQSGAGARFQLSFPTKAKVSYQLVFRQSVADSGTVVPFATASDGVASATAFAGTGSTATLFVERTVESGFYSIAVPVKQQ
jgi:nitrite reductase/ring-hydroxylating ferredoxin subunit